jgi:hypothetical protein
MPLLSLILETSPEYLSQHFESNFKRLVGTAFDIKHAASQFGYQQTPNISQAIQLS